MPLRCIFFEIVGHFLYTVYMENKVIVVHSVPLINSCSHPRSGYESEVERTIETVRGNVDVDVHAIDLTISPNLIYLCECKYWSSAVPKTIVHSFRTVVSDYGAHVGFLISRNGFQSGTYQASQNSNIRLVNWFEFQELFT